MNDYVVKSNMRNKSIWGTDIEIFGLALLTRTDIYGLMVVKWEINGGINR